MDEGLRGWLDDALLGLDASEDPAGAVQPQFAEVVARAHTIDPDVITEDHVDEARALAPVVPLGAAVVADPGPDAALAGFLDDVRADADAATQHRGLAAIPSPPPARRRPPRITMVAAAVAAVLVLGVGIAGAFSALRNDTTQPAMQAEHEALPPAPSLAVPPNDSVPEPVPAPVPDPKPEPQTDTTPAPDPSPTTDTPKPRSQKPSATPTPSLEDRLRALDERAQAHWKAGELAEAEKLFREIIRIGKRGHYVQLAYGDLFNLARDWDPKRRQKLWNQYLRSFPKGRHADDARGGLCRLAPDAEQARCWERYLKDMPDGSYRHTAVRALEKGE
jgi:hypothetical protein